MTHVFMWVPALMIVMPWKYVLQTYVMPSRAQRITENRVQATRYQPAR